MSFSFVADCRPVKELIKKFFGNDDSENLGRRCRQWPAGKADLEVKLLIEKHSQPHDLRIYTDGSVTEEKSGWGFTVQQGDCTIHEDSAAYAVTSTSLFQVFILSTEANLKVELP